MPGFCEKPGIFPPAFPKTSSEEALMAIGRTGIGERTTCHRQEFPSAHY
jgi:hypothetical protein